MKKQIVQNIIFEAFVFLGVFASWIVFQGERFLKPEMYKELVKRIPSMFLVIEWIGYALIVVSLLCFVAEILNMRKQQYLTARRLPVTKKIYRLADMAFLLAGACVIVIAVGLFVNQATSYAIAMVCLLALWLLLYVFMSPSMGLINTLAIIGSTSFFMLQMCIRFRSKMM